MAEQAMIEDEARRLAQELDCSVATARQALLNLERRGLIRATLTKGDTDHDDR